MNPWSKVSLLLLLSSLPTWAATLEWEYPGDAVNRLGIFLVYVRESGDEYDWDHPVWAEERDIRRAPGCAILGIKPPGLYHISMIAVSANDPRNVTHRSEPSNEISVDWPGDPSCEGSPKSPPTVATPRPARRPPSSGVPPIPMPTPPPAFTLPSMAPPPALASGPRDGILTSDCRYTGTCAPLPSAPPMSFPPLCGTNTVTLTDSPLWKGQPCP
jgi:hypothetical protein